jgi:hypothetical protein
MLRLSFLFLLYLVSFTCYSQTQDSLLRHAYHSKSTKELHVFYDYWASETPGLNDSFLGRFNDTVRNLYRVFQCFYRPNDIGRLGGSEWGNDIYSKIQYLIIQDQVVYGVVNTLNKELLIRNEIVRLAKGDKNKIDTLLNQYGRDSSEFETVFMEWPQPDKLDTLKEFRPGLSFSKIKTLSLTPAYKKLLDQFLGNVHDNFGKGNIMSPAKSKGESEKRQKFLENCIKIWYGHWGGYWQLYSYPYVSSIIFDSQFEHALIYFTVVYEGGYAFLKKTNGVWILVQAKRTWIE